MFDGLAGRAVAKVMARSNRAAEEEAVRMLDPAPSDAVLAIGIGPGVGLRHLSERLPTGRAVGIDPSKVMVDQARRWNAAQIAQGRVEVVRASADRLPWPDASFDGAVAVNSIQLWDPIEASVAEVARVMRPGARLVSLTHDWALKRSTGREVEGWSEWITGICLRHQLVEPQLGRAAAEHGRAVAFTVTKGGAR